MGCQLPPFRLPLVRHARSPGQIDSLGFLEGVGELKRIADGLIGTKGVTHGKFVATTTGAIA